MPTVNDVINKQRQRMGAAPSIQANMLRPTPASQIIQQRRAEQTAKQQAAADASAKQDQSLRDLVASAPEYQSSLAFPEFEQFKQYAYGQEESPYAKLLKEQAQAQTAEGLDQAAAQGQAELGNVYSQLAMGGGLSSGARERLAGGSAYQTMLAKQKERQAGAGRIADIGLQEAQQKQGAQERYLDAVAQDKAKKAQYDFDRWKQKTDVEAGILKSQAEKDIAAANSCLLEGTLVQLANGDVKPIEMIKVGDELPGGLVYCIQSAMAPDKMYSYFGTYMTGSHAVPSEDGWTRAKASKDCMEVERPAHAQLIYNLGVTHHFIVLGDGHIVGDLHETDKYEYISDVESLEAMNEAIPVRPVC